MTRKGFFLRLAVSVAIDLVDFSFGRIPLLGSVSEGVGAAALFLLWGPAGLAYLWELADMTEQADAFIPTATLIGLYVGWREGFILGRKKHDDMAKDSGDRPPRLDRR